MERRDALRAVVVAVTVLRSLWPGPAAAQADNAWRFEIAPYGLLAGLDGQAVVRGHPAPVDIPFSEVLRHLKAGAMGYIQARKGDWGVGVDFIYASLAAGRDRPSIDVTVKERILTVTGLRRLTPWAEVFIGARGNRLHGGLDLGGPLDVQVGSTKQWVEPLLGYRLRASLGPRLRASILGDVGGFDLNSATTLEVWPVLSLSVSSRARIAAGYRALYTDFRDGSGDRRFRYDVTMRGPTIGVILEPGVR